MEDKRFLKMIKKLFVLILLVFMASSSLYADVAKPDIQAVCKVKLKDGKTIEGVILTAKGGFQKYYDTNGFYVKHSNGEGPLLLFNLDFQGIDLYKGTTYYGYGVSGYSFKNPKFYFLDDITYKKYYIYDAKRETEKEIESVNGDTVFILKTKITHHIEYRLLEYIPIFPELPKELYLNHVELSVNPLKIYLKDVEKFELQLEPSEKWIKQISTIEEAWIKAHLDLEDIVLPVWFHQILKEKERYENLFEPFP